jgi:hypothetical protein
MILKGLHLLSLQPLNWGDSNKSIDGVTIGTRKLSPRHYGG